jgi:hypothetical protein
MTKERRKKEQMAYIATNGFEERMEVERKKEYGTGTEEARESVPSRPNTPALFAGAGARQFS